MGGRTSGDTLPRTIGLQAAEYEDAVTDNSTWAEGDWNRDGDFDSHNFVFAFRSSGFEQGIRPMAVPEPNGIAVFFGFMGLLALTRGVCSASDIAQLP